MKKKEDWLIKRWGAENLKKNLIKYEEALRSMA